MQITSIVLANVLLASLILNIYLYKQIKKPPKEAPTLEATQLLHDLTAGGAMVKVTVIDPSAFLLRSPR